MDKKNSTLQVRCTCCEAVLTVNASSGEVVFTEKPKKKSISFEDAVSKVRQEKETAEDRFRDAFQREEGRMKLVDQKFEEAMKHKDELEDLKRQMMDRDVRDRLERERGKLRVSPFNLSEKEIEEVEKIMTEKGLPTHEVAAEWYLKVTAPSRPSGFMSNTSPGSEDVLSNRELIKKKDSELHKNPKDWSKKEFDQAWHDVFETGRVQFS